jgi:hypothetical protein
MAGAVTAGAVTAGAVTAGAAVAIAGTVPNPAPAINAAARSTALRMMASFPSARSRTSGAGRNKKETFRT